MIATTIAALLTWSAQPDVDGFRVYVCAPNDTGKFRLIGETEARQMEVPAGTYRVTALRSGVEVDADGVEHEAAIESGWSDPIEVYGPVLPPTPVEDPGRVKITLWSSETLDRSAGRTEAIFYQPSTGPSRFWWATIETE